MFVDELEITLKAGHGGAGRASFYVHQRGPDGGDGGKGGDVYIRATTDLTILQNYSNKKELVADDGELGGKNKKTGQNGKDNFIIVPIGSVLTDLVSHEVFNINLPSQELLICKGGLGGRGNFTLRSPRMTTPLHAQRGLPGDVKQFLIELKLIADFGLIGLPNAGKSSLLNALTHSNSKVGEYSFTTLEPNLGVLNGRILADLPGLIEGASLGKGLGIKFLKHIEKTKVLLHCIACDSVDPKADYKVIRSELKKYNKELLNKEEVIILTKTDLVPATTVKKLVKKFKGKVLVASIHDYDLLEELKSYIETIN